MAKIGIMGSPIRLAGKSSRLTAMFLDAVFKPLYYALWYNKIPTSKFFLLHSLQAVILSVGCSAHFTVADWLEKHKKE